MTQYYQLDSGTNPPIFLRLAKSEVVGTKDAAMLRFFSSTSSSLTINLVPDLIDDPFELQKTAFEAIPPLLLCQYFGKWVVSKDGQIVDSDKDLQKLSGRFFGVNGRVDVYICRVGIEEPTLIRTPFLR